MLQLIICRAPTSALPTPKLALAVANFASEGEEPSLEAYEAEIDKLRKAAETIRNTCTNDVRTGEQCAGRGREGGTGVGG